MTLTSNGIQGREAGNRKWCKWEVTSHMDLEGKSTAPVWELLNSGGEKKNIGEVRKGKKEDDKPGLEVRKKKKLARRTRVYTEEEDGIFWRPATLS